MFVTFIISSVIVSQLWSLSRYSCLYLGSRIQEFYNSSFLTKKHKPALAVVNVEIALVDMKTAKVEVEAQIQINSSFLTKKHKLL